MAIVCTASTEPSISRMAVDLENGETATGETGFQGGELGEVDVAVDEVQVADYEGDMP